MISYMISYFKKDHLAYNIKTNDYEKKPLFVSSKENRERWRGERPWGCDARASDAASPGTVSVGDEEASDLITPVADDKLAS